MDLLLRRLARHLGVLGRIGHGGHLLLLLLSGAGRLGDLILLGVAPAQIGHVVGASVGSRAVRLAPGVVQPRHRGVHRRVRPDHVCLACAILLLERRPRRRHNLAHLGALARLRQAGLVIRGRAARFALVVGLLAPVVPRRRARVDASALLPIHLLERALADNTRTPARDGGRNGRTKDHAICDHRGVQQLRGRLGHEHDLRLG